MLCKQKVNLVVQKNYNQIKELVRMSFGLGVNLTTPTRFKDSLKIINITLTTISILSLYGHWVFFTRFITDIPKMTETISIAIHITISIIKMIYYLFTQRKFHQLLYKAQSHELLQKFDNFYKDLPVRNQLKKEIDNIINNTWKDIRRQLIFYLCSCSAIISNYFFGAVFLNLYHQWKKTPNYKFVLPYPVVYPMWENKGMTFPYYHIQIFTTGCASYISGMTAFSFDGLFIVLCIHAIGLVRALNIKIKYSTSLLVAKEQRVVYLRQCIYQYQRIWNYINEINLMYKHISLSQFLASLVVLGVVLFNLSISLESNMFTVLRMLMFITASFCEISIYCVNSQRLTSAIDEIPLAFYNCQWYDESKEFKQLIQMMIMRSNRKFQLSISWFVPMSLPTLMAMLKLSGSYFVLLRDLEQ